MRAVEETAKAGAPQAYFTLGFKPVAQKNVAIDICLVGRERVAVRIFESAASTTAKTPSRMRTWPR